MNMTVRRYLAEDREAVRQIAFDTALMGRSAETFFDGPDFIKDVITLYFTDHEPESVWVAESNGIVVGYITGSQDEHVMHKVFLAKILPHLFVELLRSGVLLKEKNWKLVLGALKSVLKGESKRPDFYEDYPAILHINLKDGFRRSGAGSALITALTDDFSSRGVKGVRLGTMSDAAADFFRKNGFTLLFHGSWSFLSEAAGHDVPGYLFGRKLSKI
jgi:ribosomal protein S18 acetylase RimI-like enzyme